MFGWFSSLSPNTQAAIIASLTTLLVLLLRDVLLSSWRSKREEKKESLKIYRRYAEPLASATTSLLWRLNEIFNQEGRGGFLNAPEPHSRFQSYKRKSTLYRLAALLGWIRAYKREISVLTTNSKSDIPDLESALSELESALADGPHIEVKRLKGLCNLWNLELPESKYGVEAISAHLDELLRQELQNWDAETVTTLREKEQLALCINTANFICKHLEIDPLSESVVKETQARAIQQLSIRQAWIYRDWQVGIGDIMIRSVTNGIRRFEVAGFSDFESMLLEGNSEQQRWLDRLTTVIEGLDVTGADRFDARVDQLERAMVAIAKLLVSLFEATDNKSGISKQTKSLADEIIQNDKLSV